MTIRNYTVMGQCALVRLSAQAGRRITVGSGERGYSDEMCRTSMKCLGVDGRPSWGKGGWEELQAGGRPTNAKGS